MKNFPRHSIEEDIRDSKVKYKLHPFLPFWWKPLAFHDLQHELVLHLIKCLLKIKIQNNYFLLGLMARMNVFQRPGNTVLNRSVVLYKTILILMNER